MQAFTGDFANGQITVRGNPCSVTVTADKPEVMPVSDPSASSSTGPETLSTTKNSTRCYTWPGGDRSARVACYAPNGAEIQCCGHGLLCCAAVWTSFWGGAGSLQAGDTTLLCKRQDNTLWLGFPKTPSADGPAPAWLAPLLAAPVVSCSEIGDAQGYLIAQLKQDYDLGKIEPPGDSLMQYTRRALIVTCRVKTTGTKAGEHFHFRYFAPQYGVPEDVATGSAMRLLTIYWQQHGAGEKMLALQRSPEGGWLRGHIDRDRVWVGGNVKVEAGSGG